MPAGTVYEFLLNQDGYTTNPGNQARILIWRGDPGPEQTATIVECDPIALELNNDWVREFEKYPIGLRQAESFKIKVDLDMLPSDLALYISNPYPDYSSSAIDVTTVWLFQEWNGLVGSGRGDEWQTLFMGSQKVGIKADWKPGVDHLLDVEVFDVRREILEMISFKGIGMFLNADYGADRITTDRAFDFHHAAGDFEKGGSAYKAPAGFVYHFHKVNHFWNSLNNLITVALKSDTSYDLTRAVLGITIRYGIFEFLDGNVYPFYASYHQIRSPLNNLVANKQTYDGTGDAGADLMPDDLYFCAFVTKSGEVPDTFLTNVTSCFLLGAGSLEEAYPKGIYEWLAAEYKAHLAKDTFKSDDLIGSILYLAQADPVYGGPTYTLLNDEISRKTKSVSVMQSVLNKVQVGVRVNPSNIYGEPVVVDNATTVLGNTLELTQSFHNVPISEKLEHDSHTPGHYQCYTGIPMGVLFYYDSTTVFTDFIGALPGGFVRIHEKCYYTLDASTTSSSLNGSVSSTLYDNAVNDEEWDILAAALQGQCCSARNVASAAFKLFGSFKLIDIAFDVPWDSQNHIDYNIAGHFQNHYDRLAAGNRIEFDPVLFVEGSPYFSQLADNVIICSWKRNIKQNKLVLKAMPVVYP